MPSRPPIDPSIERTPRYDESCPPGGVSDNCPQAPVLREIASNVRKVLLHIDGDGTEDRPGMKIKIDRLERTTAWHDTLLKGTIALILLTVAAAVLGMVVLYRGPIRAVMGLDREASSTLAGGWNP